MSLYKNILFATDLGQDSQHVCDIAKELKRVHGATLNIVHVIEPIGAYGGNYYYIEDMNEQIEKEALEHLSQYSNASGIPPKQQFLCKGHPKHAIIDMADELGADLIVLGSHGARGISVLLGSTATYVLSHAHCDVLTVPLKRFDDQD
tara:strand:- start:9419 stop:9862 length:444 start_codon:yes stop_codon:yes gene_type:complete